LKLAHLLGRIACQINLEIHLLIDIPVPYTPSNEQPRDHDLHPGKPENGWLEDDFPFEMASFQPRTVSFFGCALNKFSSLFRHVDFLLELAWDLLPEKVQRVFLVNLCLVQIPNLPTYIFGGLFCSSIF